MDKEGYDLIHYDPREPYDRPEEEDEEEPYTDEDRCADATAASAISSSRNGIEDE